MATLKETKKKFAAIVGTAEANAMYEKLEKLEKSLPAGITLAVFPSGITYSVRTSYVNPVGGQVKVSLGTFNKFVDAVNALFVWKLNRALKDVSAELIEEAQTNLKKSMQTIVAEELKQAALPVAEAAAEAVDGNHLEILSALPPFMIPVEGDYTVASPFDGIITTIPAATIAEWFRREQAQADQVAAETHHESMASRQLAITAEATSGEVKDN